MWPFRRAKQAERTEPPIVAASPENPSTNLADPASWLTDWASGGAPGTFGPHVSERTAMCCSAVNRCVVLISGIVAGLPLKIYRRTPDGRDEAPNHRLQPMFKMAPFPGRAMTSFVWREMWMVNTLLWGNHVSIIRYDGAARIIGFEPVMPWDVEVYRLNHRNVYRCVIWDTSFGPTDGGVGSKIEWHDQDDIIHIPGLGFNGVRGLSRIRAFARDAISLSKLMEEQTGRVHENAARPSGLVTVPPKISKDGFERFKAQFNDQNAGRFNAGRVVFGDAETKYTQFQMSQEDMNTLALRGFQVADISRFFGVPLHLLNQIDKSTCMPGDVLVSSEFGPVRIDQIKVGQKVWSLDEKTGAYRLSKVWRAECTGCDPILTIETRTRTLRANAQHRVLVRRKFPARRVGSRGKPPIEWKNVWLRADEIKEGDYLLAPYEMPEQDGEIAPNGRFLTERFMAFAGLLIGDGTVTVANGLVSIARHADASYAPSYKEHAAAEFDRAAMGGTHTSDKRPRRPITWRDYDRNMAFSSIAASRELRELGLAGTAHTKRVPAWVFGLKHSLILAFLRGYLDSDGAVSEEGWITWSSCNLELIEDVRHLCMLAGVPVSRARRYDCSGQVEVMGRMVTRGAMFQAFCFHVQSNRRIGSHHAIKMARLATAPMSQRISTWSSSYKGRGPKGSRPGESFAVEGTALLPVKRITVEPAQDVYDLGVEGTETFIADGIVVHNSWGTGLSEQTLAFLIYTLDPDLGRIEAELNYKLFNGTEFYAEFDRDAMMAMDPLKAAQVAQTEISTGVLLINERRRHKNRPPVENGDEPLINSTNVPLAKIFLPTAQPVADPLASAAPGGTDPAGDAPAEEADSEDGGNDGGEPG